MEGDDGVQVKVQLRLLRRGIAACIVCVEDGLYYRVQHKSGLGRPYQDHIGGLDRVYVRTV